MSRIKLETLKTIFTSEYWLIAALCGAFFSFFALNRGGIVVFIEGGICFLIIDIFAGNYRPKEIQLSYWITAGICAYLLLVSVLFHFQLSHYRWMANLVRMLCVVFVIDCLFRKSITNRVAVLFAVVLSAAVCWQIMAYFVFKMPYGTFSNPHYIASFTVLTLPAIVYFSLVAKSWYKFPLIALAVMDLALIFKIASRPAILGLTAGAIFVLIFLIKDRWKWIGLSLVFAIFGVLFLSGYGGVFAKFEELIVNLPKEERVRLWISSWNMLSDNTLVTWIFGNGIGSFRTVFPQYATSDLRNPMIVSPHNYLLEILYENGIIAAILVFGGIGLLFISAIKASIHARQKNSRILLRCMIVILISWLIHTGLTFPFYSKYAQYSLAFILGPILVMLNSPYYRRNQNLQQNEYE
jgi:O-antigen ligase